MQSKQDETQLGIAVRTSAHPASIGGIWVLSSGHKTDPENKTDGMSLSLSHSQLSVWGIGSVIPTPHGPVLSVWEQIWEGAQSQVSLICDASGQRFGERAVQGGGGCPPHLVRADSQAEEPPQSLYTIFPCFALCWRKHLQFLLLWVVSG